jgi:hypothetical protein
MTGIVEAILALDSTAQVSVQAEDVNQIIWHDGNPNSITVSQIQTKQTELQTAYDAKAYARTRAAAYPSVGDQLDMLWHAIEANATLKTRYADFHTAIKAVKDANPKP